MSDLLVLVLLAVYVFVAEFRIRNNDDRGTWKEGGCCEQRLADQVVYRLVLTGGATRS